METQMAPDVDVLAASTPVGTVSEQATPDALPTAAEPAEAARTVPDPRDEEIARLRGTLSQVEQWAQATSAQQQQQEVDAQFAARRQKIIDRASDMSPMDAQRYLADEMWSLQEDRINAERQRLAAAEQQWQGRFQEMAKPQWVDKVMKDHGLPESDRAVLSTVAPDAMPAMAQFMKQQHAQAAALNEQITQLSRTQQAGVLQASGVGNVGGSAPAGSVTLPDDPDDRAMAIYRQLMGGGD